MKAKKALSIFLTGAVLFTSVGCSASLAEPTAKQQAALETKASAGLKIWSAPSYVKILQNKDYSAEEAYSAYYTNSTFAVSMYKNEFEAGQLLLTPAEDISSYTVKLSELVSESGAKIPVEAMTVYNQKYVDVSIPSKAQTNSIIGMTPDAVLPFEKAVEYGENKIAANENQGIVIEIATAENQAAGVYTGTFTLTADGKNYNVPASVTVWDATVSSTNHLLSSFLMKQEKVFAAELDASYEMYEKYYDKLLEYRICATSMPLHNAKDFDEYLSQLKKYHKHEKASTIQFFDCSNSAWTDYDYDVFAKALVDIAEESFQEGENYLEKLVYYLGMIDEPHITGTVDKVAPMLKRFAKARRKAIKNLQANKETYAADEELFASVIEKIENFPFVVTTAYRENFLYENNKSEPEDPEEEYKITWCPPFDSCNTARDRDNNSWEELDAWWYGCDYPTNPYPNYHLDEALLPTRLTSWMQYNYDVTGNLYWAINDCSDQNTYGVSEPPENVYEDLANENRATNGEGFLAYPGKMYGLDCFVPSLRLLGIRDGMEDYEVLKATGDKCKAIASDAGYENYDINVTFSKLYEALYQGSKIMGDHNDFTVSRELLSNFAVFADKGAIVADVANGMFSTDVKVYVSDGVLKVNGKEASFVSKGAGKEYTVSVQQTEKENYLEFVLEQKGENSTFRMFVGGKKSAVALDKIEFTGNSVVNDVTSVKNQDGSVTLTLGGVKKSDLDDPRQRIYLTGDTISDNLKKSKEVQAILFEIENLGEEFTLSIRYTGTRSEAPMDFLTQKVAANGKTVITVGTGTLQWDFGAIKELRFYVESGDQTKEVTFTLKQMTLAY